MEKSLQLPPQDDDVGNPDNQIRSKVPLRIAFSVLKVSRADPAEKRLVEMLDHFLEKPGTTQGPIVFPVFGAAGSWRCCPAQSLTSDALQEAGDFLCGNCTCMMKGQLPGADLLLAADWESLWEGRAVRSEPPGLAGLGAGQGGPSEKPLAASQAGPQRQESEARTTAAEPVSPGQPASPSPPGNAGRRRCARAPRHALRPHPPPAGGVACPPGILCSVRSATARGTSCWPQRPCWWPQAAWWQRFRSWPATISAASSGPPSSRRSSSSKWPCWRTITGRSPSAWALTF